QPIPMHIVRKEAVMAHVELMLSDYPSLHCTVLWLGEGQLDSGVFQSREAAVRNFRRSVTFPFVGHISHVELIQGMQRQDRYRRYVNLPHQVHLMREKYLGVFDIKSEFGWNPHITTPGVLNMSPGSMVVFTGV